MPPRYVDIDNTITWSPWKKRLCDNCSSLCCTLPVEVHTTDLVRMGLIHPFEMEEPAKNIAKRLKKAGIISHLNVRDSIFTLAQHSSGDCLYLNRETRRCTIYPTRPETCRNHPAIGPRPGFCPHEAR
ncbi:YkgJ family cysteine cluster protein [Oceanicoccus sp. KOV_DT_Chl]|uniref:YkgJ family cysteine cluster protein n=1 Tax=Oceanicoccus sp. KOV_DT_Chl TaxID=1904639 RepID=UPI000C7DAC86|nr:YkgJ family cysteine cluster protein [Oceanicoccus sp. KOV_DT_Chl]